GLKVGAVAHHRRLTLAVHDGRRRRRRKPTGEDPVASGVKLVIEGAGRGERLLHLLLGAVAAELAPVGGAVHGQQVVRHPSSPQLRAVPMTAFHSTTSSIPPIRQPAAKSCGPVSPWECPFGALPHKHPTLVCRLSSIPG